MSAKGIVRSITHWTGGGGRASSDDKDHYHKITEFDGNVVEGLEKIEDNIVTSDGDYAAHTLNLNTGSGGFAMAGMRGAVESPFNPGPSPINERQFEAHCKMLAEFHTAFGIPVTQKTCLTHAEVQPTLGVLQRGKWDLTRLPFKPELRGAIPVGDYMRERVRSYMPYILPGATNRPVLRRGDRGMFVSDLQELLTRVRIFTGRIDGDFGPRTEKAVVAFQVYSSLDTDGVVGPATWGALMTKEPVPERDVDERDLRNRGSRTIETADRAETAAKTSAGAVMGLGTIEVALDVVENFNASGDALAAAQSLLLENWAILAVMAIGGVGYFYGPKLMGTIRGFRVDDAKTGANLKR